MRPIRELTELTARWTGALLWRPRYRLAHGKQLFATLDWETASGSLVVARWQDRVAAFERANFATSRVVLRDEPYGPELGSFVADWREGGRLTLRSGRSWRLQPESSSLSHWSVRDIVSESVLEVRVDSMRLTPGGSLAVAKGSADLPELPLLVALSWYVAVQAVDDCVMLPGSPSAS